MTMEQALDGVLGNVDATRDDRRRALVVAGVLLVAFAATAPWANVPLRPVPAFAPLYDAAVAVLDLVTAALLYAQFRHLRERAFLALACGYLFTPVLIAAHALSFPDAFVSGSLIGDAQTTAWLWMGWHACFPLFVARYALRARAERDGRVPNDSRPPSRGVAAIGATLLAAAILVAVAMRAESLLPPLMFGAQYRSGATRVVLAVGWLAHVAALGALLWATRLRRLIDVWLAVTLVALVIDLALSAILVEGRFRLGFYLGRAYGLLGAAFVLGVLLREIVALYGNAVRSGARLRDSEARQAFLLTLSDTLRAEASVDAVGHRAVQMLAERLGADRVYLVTLNSDDDRVTVTHETRRADLPPLLGEYRSSTFPRAIRELFERTIVYEDVRTDPRLTDLDRASFAGLNAVGFIAASLRRGDGAMIWAAGAVCTEPRAWSPAEVTLFEDAIERTWAAIERARAEAALRASEEKYRSLFREMDEAYAVVEVIADAAGRWTDFRFLEVNDAFMRHTSMPHPVGRTATELLGTPNPRWAALYGQVAATGEPLRLEESELTLGRVFDLNIFRLGGPGSRRVAVLFSDITERKRRDENRELLVAVSEALGRLSDEAELVATVGARLVRHLGATGYQYVDVDESRGEVTVRHVWHEDDVPDVRRTYPISGFVSPHGLERLRAGEPSVVHDVAALTTDDAATAGLRAGAAAQRIGAFVAAPSSRDGQWRAYFAVSDSGARRWTADEVELIQEVAGRLVPRIERARAEAALRESETRTRFQAELLASAAEAMVATDEQLLITYWNRAAEELLGWTAEEALGQPSGTVFQTTVPGSSREAVIARIREHGGFQGELIYRHRDDGRAVLVEARTAALRAPDGRLSGTVTAFHDVSERKRAEDALRESEERQAFLLTLSDALRPIDDAGAAQSIACRVLGEQLDATRVNYAEVVGHDYIVANEYHWAELRSMAGRYPLASFRAAERAAFERGHTVVVADILAERGLTDAEAEAYGALAVRAFVSVPLVKSGRLVAVLSVIRATPGPWRPHEVTLVEETAERTWAAVERARVEGALRDSELRFRTVADLVPDLLWQSEPDGATLWYNARWTDYTGQSSAHALGWGWAEALHPEDRERATTDYAHAAARGSRTRCAFGDTTARIAGSSCAQSRCATRAATSCAGSARRPTSMRSARHSISSSSASPSGRRSATHCACSLPRPRRPSVVALRASCTISWASCCWPSR